MFKMDHQQGPTVQHMDLCSVFCGSLDGRGVWETMDTGICMAESLCCPPETITILLISYIPIQNKKFKKKPMFYVDHPADKWKTDMRGRKLGYRENC